VGRLSGRQDGVDSGADPRAAARRRRRRLRTCSMSAATDLNGAIRR
jgi:hypothetical protein